ncbi:hypothetical protein K469DRAFT_165535 [Zopfia rhizophila CBS 207.26]|uniref:Uncharacterized protein n=1 Tax=Zopfia rhizophila CBS 207.26 TaxID=1314779 RepID=A0A6A6E008_9PEZI|nr:hypothetical protein K469DRAFT_165535 [Zopfia rhizophila CBS 207.26]
MRRELRRHASGHVPPRCRENAIRRRTRTKRSRIPPGMIYQCFAPDLISGDFSCFKCSVVGARPSVKAYIYKPMNTIIVVRNAIDAEIVRELEQGIQPVARKIEIRKAKRDAGRDVRISKAKSARGRDNALGTRSRGVNATAGFAVPNQGGFGMAGVPTAPKAIVQGSGKLGRANKTMYGIPFAGQAKAGQKNVAVGARQSCGALAWGQGKRVGNRRESRIGRLRREEKKRILEEIVEGDLLGAWDRMKLGEGDVEYGKRVSREG